ncbi:MAG: hypothetical protein AMK70_03820 [Nitrospira bacterium SG8_35_1]|nr:MAG: hypothetical protein AMK70_03820 [Nitrospira bacterium SG8_35_1]
MDREVIEMARSVNLPAYIECVEGLTPRRRSPRGLFYLSPFRTEKVPSLHVSNRDGIWLWFDHGAVECTGGDAIEFVRKLKDCSFKEAVEILLDFDGHTGTSFRETNNKGGIGSINRTSGFSGNGSKFNKIFWVRDFYEKLPKNYITTIKKYFTDRGLKFHEELGCKVHFHFNDKLRYIVFPLPNCENVRGIELKEICNLQKELGLTNERKKRKCYGTKTIWAFKRDTSRLLVAESIIDALAGEIILDDNNISLAALNGVAQVAQLDQVIKALKSKKVFLSIDDDGAGQEANKVARQILIQNRVAHEVLNIKQKDLFRELHATEMKEVNQHAGNGG